MWFSSNAFSSRETRSVFQGALLPLSEGKGGEIESLTFIEAHDAVS